MYMLMNFDHVGGAGKSSASTHIAPVRLIPRETSIFYAVMAVPVGGMDEYCQEEGISHLLEHLMFVSDDGVDTMSFARDRGVTCNAFTSRTHTVYFVQSTTDNWEAGMDVFTSIVANSMKGLSEERIQQEVNVVMHEASLSRGYDVSGNPSLMCSVLFEQFMTMNTLQDTGLIGTAETLQSITKQQLSTFMSEMYSGTRRIVIVCNDKIEYKVMRAAKTKLTPFLNRQPWQSTTTFETQGEYRRARAIEVLADKRKGCTYDTHNECEDDDEDDDTQNETKKVQHSNKNDSPPSTYIQVDKTERFIVYGRDNSGDTESSFLVGMKFLERLTYRETILMSMFTELVDSTMFKQLRTERGATYTPRTSFVNITRGIVYHGHCSFHISTLQPARMIFQVMMDSIAYVRKTLLSDKSQFIHIQKLIEETYQRMFADDKETANYIAMAACDWNVWIMPEEIIETIHDIKYEEMVSFLDVLFKFPVLAVAVVPENIARSTTTTRKMLYALLETIT